MLIDATLPLLAAHGEMVTTAEIAAAAGVAEGTMFRIFADKAELVAACLSTATRADDTEVALAAAHRHPDLSSRLAAAGTALREYFGRVGPLFASPTLIRHEWAEGTSPNDVFLRLNEHVAALFVGLEHPVPLRADPALLAHLFVLLFAAEGSGRAGSSTPLPIDQVVDVLLTGALADPLTPQRSTHQ